MDRWDYLSNNLCGLESYLGVFLEGDAETHRPIPSGYDLSAAPQLYKALVLTTQQIVQRFGAKLTADGLYGPASQKAWQDLAKAKGLDPTYTRVDGKNVNVNAATLTALSSAAASVPAPATRPVVAAAKPAATPAAAKPAAVAPKPAAVAASAAAPAASANTVRIPVLTAQQLVQKYGAKLTADGLFGPATQKAWQDLAKLKGLATTFTRVDGKNVNVDASTLVRLQDAAPAVAAPAPVAAKPATPKTTVKPSAAPPIKATVTAGPTEPSRAGLIQASIGTLQDLLNKLGAKLKRDGLFGPSTKTAWAARAAALKVSPTFDRAGPTDAWVDPQAYSTISAKAGVPQQEPTGAPPPSATPTTEAPAAPAAPTVSPAQQQADLLVKNASASVPVLVLQQAMLSTGKFPSVAETGVWDDATQSNFIALFGIPTMYAEAWSLAWPALLSGDKTTIRLLDAQAKNATAAAQIYMQRKVTEQQAADAAAAAQQAPAQSAVPAAPTQDDSRWQAAVASASTAMSVLQMQQALRQLYELQREGKIPASPALSAVAVTGSWNPATDDVALMGAFGNRFFPNGQASQYEWDNVLSRILTGTTLKGWGFADLANATWAGTSQILMPPAAVKDVQRLATDYLLRTAPQQPQQDTVNIPIPQGGSNVALDPTLIQGQVPIQPQPAPYVPPEPAYTPPPTPLTPNYTPPQPQVPFYEQQPAPAPIIVAQPSGSVSLNVSQQGNSDAVPATPELAPIVATPPSNIPWLWIALAGVGGIAIYAIARNQSEAAPAAAKRKR